MESVFDGKFPERENEGPRINLFTRPEILTMMSVMELGISVVASFLLPTEDSGRIETNELCWFLFNELNKQLQNGTFLNTFVNDGGQY